MPQADKRQRWNNSETEKILTYINNNFDLWFNNHGSTCAKAIETYNINRDAKSVYNKIHNMIKVMEDYIRTRKKTNAYNTILDNKKIYNLLKEICKKTKEKRENQETRRYDQFFKILTIICIYNFLLLLFYFSANQVTTKASKSQMDVDDEDKYKFSELAKKIDQRRAELKKKEEELEIGRAELEKMEEKLVIVMPFFLCKFEL